MAAFVSARNSREVGVRWNQDSTELALHVTIAETDGMVPQRNKLLSISTDRHNQTKHQISLKLSCQPRAISST